MSKKTKRHPNHFPPKEHRWQESTDGARVICLGCTKSLERNDPAVKTQDCIEGLAEWCEEEEEDQVKWAWSVTERGGGINFGVADSFDLAIRALAAWQGMEEDPPHSAYLITPVLPIQE